jgi:hypothetical protein
LSLDADETLDDELKHNLKQLPLNQDIEVFRFSFKFFRRSSAAPWRLGK